MRLLQAALVALSFLAGNFSKAVTPEPPIMKMSSNVGLFSASSSASVATTSASIQSELDRFLQERKPASNKRDWEIQADGKISFDKNLWSVEKDADGGEVFTAKRSQSASEIKRSVIRNEDQTIRTISEYRITKDQKENFWFVFFLDQKLAAATTCTDKTPNGLRNCVTAIPSVCKSLPKNKATGSASAWSLPKPVIPDVDLVEKRAIATVVSLRGEGHQMENMAKTGNLIGLKDKHQTTRGRLTSAPVKSEFIQEAADLCERAKL